MSELTFSARMRLARIRRDLETEEAAERARARERAAEATSPDARAWWKRSVEPDFPLIESHQESIYGRDNA